jgi:hypothetical protein
MLAFGLLLKYLIPYLRTHMTAEQMAMLRAGVQTAVYGIDQLYKSEPGQKKKELVLKWLKDNGYILDAEKVEDEVNVLIESFVKELNLGKQP